MYYDIVQFEFNCEKCGTNIWCIAVKEEYEKYVENLENKMMKEVVELLESRTCMDCRRKQ